MIAAEQTLLAGLFRGAMPDQTPGRFSWDARGRRWITLDRDLGREVLRSPSFAVRPHHDFLADLGRSKNLGLAAAVDSFGASPLSHDGPRHRELRLAVARYVQQRSPDALAAFETVVNGPVCARLQRPGDCDLMTEVIEPAVNRLFARLTGAPEDLFAGTLASGHCVTQLLSTACGGFSRQRLAGIDARLAGLRAAIDGEPREAAMTVAVLAVSYQILLAALGNSLAWSIAQTAGSAMRKTQLPADLPVTSIPFVDRICSNDLRLGGADLAAGDVVLVYLGGFDAWPTGSRADHFGTGPHICVGKALAESAWRSLAEMLSGLDRRICLKQVAYRDLDYTLVSPRRILAEVLP